MQADILIKLYLYVAKSQISNRGRWFIGPLLVSQTEAQRMNYRSTKILQNIAKKKDFDAPSILHLLADGQLLIYVDDAVSPSIRYL